MTEQQQAELDSLRSELDAERVPFVVDEIAEVFSRARSRLGLSLAVAVRAERAAGELPPPVDRSKIEYSVWVEKWMLEHAHGAEWRRDFQRQHQNQWRLWELASRPLTDAEIFAHLARSARKRGIVIEDAVPGGFAQQPTLEAFAAKNYACSPFLSDRLADHDRVSQPVLSPWDRMALENSWNNPPPPIPPEGTFDESP